MPDPAPYDFARPRLLTQEQARTLRAVHDRFGRALAADLSARLHALVALDVTAVEEAAAAPAPTADALVFALRDGASGDRLALAVDPRFALHLTERLLGGAGDAAPEPRPLTATEDRLVRRALVEPARQALEAAWAETTTLALHPADPAPAAPGATGVVRLRVAAGGVETALALAYPAALLARAFAGAAPDAEAVDRERFEAVLRETTVEVRAELGRTRLPLADLVGLREGDVIPLDGRASDPLTLFVGAAERFRAAAGRTGRRHAVRILSVLAAPDAPEGPGAPPVS